MFVVGARRRGHTDERLVWVVTGVRARRAGLERSTCLQRDTRLVLAYLGLLAVAGAVGAARPTLAVFGVQ